MKSIHTTTQDRPIVNATMTHPTLFAAAPRLLSQSAPQQTARLQTVEGYDERPQKHRGEI